MNITSKFIPSVIICQSVLKFPISIVWFKLVEYPDGVLDLRKIISPFPTSTVERPTLSSTEILAKSGSIVKLSIHRTVLCQYQLPEFYHQRFRKTDIWS